jgi:hypothetical protein
MTHTNTARLSRLAVKGVELVKETKTGELVTNADAAEQGVLFADDADGLATDFIEAIDHRFHNRQVDLSLGPATNSKK